MIQFHTHTIKAKVNCLICSLLIISSALAKAQTPETFNVTIHDAEGTTHTEEFELPLSMSYPIDSLLADWKTKNLIDLGKDCSTSNENPLFSDSIYIDRLARIPAVIEMPYNDIVRQFIEQYTGRMRQRMSLMLSLSNYYMPMFEDALLAYDLPLELKYLPIVESSLNPNAISRAKASGLWQFMNTTGKLYGLENNSLVDERQDPIKSSWAAARYLHDMYEIYGDWTLVLAAYNCGPGNVNKAISRSGGETDYWKIYHYLPKETRGYIPSFIAVNYVMNYYCNHNICPLETNIPEATDTIEVNHNVHFQQIADVCGVDVGMIKSLNPQYKRNIIPGDSKPQALRLPQQYIGTFLQLQDSVYAYRSTEFFKNRRIVETPQQTTVRQGSASRNKKATGSGATHTIRKGETLSTIASRYGVTVNQLKQWNGISGTKITAGQKLKIAK